MDLQSLAQRYTQQGRPVPPALAAALAGTPTPAPPGLTPEQLAAYASAARYAKETGGITVNGLAIPTDDRAKLLLMGAANEMAATATAPFVLNGVVTTLTGAQFQAIYQAIVAHVQACFAAEATLLAGINATPATITTTAQIDSALAAVTT